MGWQDKIAAPGAETGGPRIQYGSLCWRMTDRGIEVLLITSRDTGRWIIPKGWPMPGLAPEAAAAQEAWEEAGVQGVTNPLSLGRYGYTKCLSVKASIQCAVVIYGLEVVRVADSFPEAKERRRKWFPLQEAAGLVIEQDLARIIADFAPPVAGRPGPITGDGAPEDDRPFSGRAKAGPRKSH